MRSKEQQKADGRIIGEMKQWIKVLLFERCGGKCEACGKPNNCFEIHHCCYGDAITLNDLALLCRACHYAKHGRKIRKVWKFKSCSTDDRPPSPLPSPVELNIHCKPHWYKLSCLFLCHLIFPKNRAILTKPKEEGQLLCLASYPYRAFIYASLCR